MQIICNLRETLLTHLANVVEAGKREVTERIGSNDVPVGRHLTEIAAKLIYIRQGNNKVHL